MTADYIRRTAIQVIADQQAHVGVYVDKDVLVHLLGYNNGVLALAKELIDSLAELDSEVSEE